MTWRSSRKRKGVLRRYSRTLPHLTSTISRGQNGDKSGFQEYFSTSTVQKKGQTTTGAIKLQLERPKTSPTKALSNVCWDAGMLKNTGPDKVFSSEALADRENVRWKHSRHIPLPRQATLAVIIISTSAGLKSSK